MLGCIELAVLGTVEHGDTISELTREPDHRKSYLYRALGGLVEKGSVYTERDGRRKRIVPSDAQAVDIYQDLVRQHSHIDFPELLTGKLLEVLYHFDQLRAVSEIVNQTDNYRNKVNRVFKRLRERGLVARNDGRYVFNGNLDRLHEFARELAHHLHRQRHEAAALIGADIYSTIVGALSKYMIELIDAKLGYLHRK